MLSCEASILRAAFEPRKWPSSKPLISDPSIKPLISDPSIKPMVSDSSIKPLISAPNGSVRKMPTVALCAPRAEPSVRTEPLIFDPSIKPLISDSSIKPLSSASNGSVRKMPTVAVCAPRADPSVRTEPLSKEDLIGYFASGYKSNEKWRIGTEIEIFGFDVHTLKPLNYAQISRLLHGLAEKFGWERYMEEGNLVGLQKDGQTISLEGGGQIELSGAPLPTLHHTCAELTSYLDELKTLGQHMGFAFLGAGSNPKWPLNVTPIMPKPRIQLMRHVYPRLGTLGLDMLFRTGSIQVSLDFESEQDMVKKLRVGLALQPLVTAIFANSPFTEGKPNGYLSYRSHVWTDVDKVRTGALPFVFEDDFGFDKYVDYALSVPMLCLYHDKHYIDCSGLSFKDLMLGKSPKFPGYFATMNDWEFHLGCIFTDVRLRRYLEMRGADVGACPSMLYALPAFWVGLLYDNISLQGAYDIIRDWTDNERAALKTKVPQMGLRTPFRNGTLKHVAQDVLVLARGGLQRRGCMEAHFLDGIKTIVETGKPQAELLLDLYKGEWNENIDRIFEELRY